MRTGCLAAIRRQQPALHFAVKRWISARDDQAPAGDDHPAAVLAANGVDPAEARDGIAGIHLIHAMAVFDQCAAIGDVAEHPAFHRRQPCDFGLGRRRRGRNRAGDFLRGGRDGRRRSRRRGAEFIDGLAEPGELGGGLNMRLLDLFEAVAGLVVLAHGEP